MKKSWIIVLAFVFLYSAVPAFSAPRPVPKRLCWLFDDDYLSIRLLPESKGKIRGVEYFDMTGSFSFPGNGQGDFLLNGSAHRKGKNVLHLGLTGTFDVYGPGGGDHMIHVGFDGLYNLKTKEGVMSFMDSDGFEAVWPIAGVGCSSLPKPLW